ncbi:aromatic ring hydroxylase [Rhodococcus ruber Chol-4]|uniref:Putative FAD-dependent oxidoreductase n=3 Tax=Rhodococcus ruber TaxID=1830 RepID=A0A098BMP0_9NOCA|nr:MULTISPECIES: FAD-dependent monooxygenase [Rhodococcus]MDO2378990.1 FAD-dependent monooxygenase [Rhodococcus ruber]ATQ30151.1 aromatic ring hydroxylase [Rhodococcus ruber]AUM19170.1 aromatic ring hydroxylase [Rhodococcus ruber]AWG97123.1 FAD-dependent oxidoreductase [Rhodococcus ruber]AXY49507.1 aromatic ring hydroxylase [Rhodococcus ruber]
MTRSNSGKAAVLGGGIGGLTAANALVRRGWHVDVFERSPALPATGTALGMWPAALDALASAGLAGAVERLGVALDRGAIVRPDGRPLARMRTRRPAVLLSRPALLGLLAAGLPDEVLRLGRAAPPLTELGAYDVVIGADGLGSPTRDALFGPGHRPVHAGLAAWRGWVDGTVDTATETWGAGALFGITPREGGLVNWFAAVRAPVGTTGGADDLVARFGDWHPAVRDVLDRLDPATVLHHEIYQSPPLPSYVRGNVALLGDAAHAMTPNLGRGACEAIVDAATLAGLLARFEVPEALGRYDRARRRTTRLLVRASYAASRVATAERGTALRDAVLRLAPQRA